MNQTSDDWALLAAYANEGSHEAFGRVVGRYADFVSAVARRRVRDTQLAEDVTQSVFIVLARRAGHMRGRASLASWLHQTTILAAASATRAETRRKRREKAGFDVAQATRTPASDSGALACALDDAMESLGRADRDVLSLHYLEDRSVQETAIALGISIEATKKRLSRSLKRLRRLLEQRGVALPQTGSPPTEIPLALIGVVKSSSGASLSVNVNAIAGGTSGNSYTIAQKVIHIMKISALKKLAVGLAASLLLVGGTIRAMLVTWRIAYPDMPASASSTQPTTQGDTNRLLATIAQANRNNRTMLASISAEFTDEIAGQNHHTNAGKWVAKGDRIYITETTQGTGETTEYGHAGDLSWVRMSGAGGAKGGGTVLKSMKADTAGRPPSMIPWSSIDLDISVRLDSLSTKDGTIENVQRSTAFGKQWIVVTLNRPLPGGAGTAHQAIWYSLENGYMPMRYLAAVTSSSGDVQADAEVKGVRQIAVNGSFFYLPEEFVNTESAPNGAGFTETYKIKPDSVQINPTVPDSLFAIRSEPGDSVIDSDLVGKPDASAQVQAARYSPVAVPENTPATQPAAKLAPIPSIDLGDGVAVDLVPLPGGTFSMGSPPTEVGYEEPILSRVRQRDRMSRPNDEGPVHQVQVAGFEIGKFKITYEQYRKFRADYPSTNIDDNVVGNPHHPVIANGENAIAFCKWLSGKSGRNVRLPTEAEWEYACRAGTQTRFFWGDREEDAGKFANVGDIRFSAQWPDRTYTVKTDDGNAFLCDVGQYKPNAFGLYDMIGDLSEWCSGDYYENAYDPKLPKGEPMGWIVRGGGWGSDITHIRCASRAYGDPRSPFSYVGFRVAVDAAIGTTDSQPPTSE